jgi:hypothetical protein
LYEIDSEGGFSEIDDWEADENSMYCAKCLEDEVGHRG